MSDIKHKFAEIKATIKAAKEQAAQTAKQAFTEISSSVFAENPELVSFSWTQCTPFFNDGEACTFSASKDYINLRMTTESDEEDDDCEDEFSLYDLKEGDFPNRKSIPKSRLSPRQKAGKAALELLSLFDDDDLLLLFGDHARVRVTKSDVTVEEYEHD